jgi:hypothetical protein
MAASLRGKTVGVLRQMLAEQEVSYEREHGSRGRW